MTKENQTNANIPQKVGMEDKKRGGRLLYPCWPTIITQGGRLLWSGGRPLWPGHVKYKKCSQLFLSTCFWSKKGEISA